MKTGLALVLLISTGCSAPLWHIEKANPKPKTKKLLGSGPTVSACSPMPTTLCGEGEFSARRSTECFVHVLGEGYHFVCPNGKKVPANNGCGFSCE